jgi:hypothetical protein
VFGWFGALYNLIAEADTRFGSEGTSDAYFGALFVISGTVLGPGLIVYGWSTFVRASWRHVIGVSVSLLLLYHRVFFLAGTEMEDDFNLAVFTLLLAIPSAIFNLIFPLGILIREVKASVRSAQRSENIDLYLEMKEHGGNDDVHYGSPINSPGHHQLTGMRHRGPGAEPQGSTYHQLEMTGMRRPLDDNIHYNNYSNSYHHSYPHLNEIKEILNDRDSGDNEDGDQDMVSAHDDASTIYEERLALGAKDDTYSVYDDKVANNNNSSSSSSSSNQATYAAGGAPPQRHISTGGSRAGSTGTRDSSKLQKKEQAKAQGGGNYNPPGDNNNPQQVHAGGEVQEQHEEESLPTIERSASAASLPALASSPAAGAGAGAAGGGFFRSISRDDSAVLASASTNRNGSSGGTSPNPHTSDKQNRGRAQSHSGVAMLSTSAAAGSNKSNDKGARSSKNKSNGSNSQQRAVSDLSFLKTLKDLDTKDSMII